jgi:hypothetical protein
MAIGKGLRFDIFARDGFVCQYCGQRPPDVVLELDHIHPRSKDGTDDPINLITSCFDCNRGKSAKIISQVAPRPDADLMLLKAQQEMAEVQRYLEVRKERDSAIKTLCNSFDGMWIEYLTVNHRPSLTCFIGWLERFGPEELEQAIRIAAKQVDYGRFGNLESWTSCDNLARYISGILRKRGQDRKIEAEQIEVSQ